MNSPSNILRRLDDQEAFDLLLERIELPLSNYIQKLCFGQLTREKDDILQDVMLALVKSAPTVDSWAALYRWVCVVARNRVAERKHAWFNHRAKIDDRVPLEEIGVEYADPLELPDIIESRFVEDEQKEAVNGFLRCESFVEQAGKQGVSARTMCRRFDFAVRKLKDDFEPADRFGADIRQFPNELCCYRPKQVESDKPTHVARARLHSEPNVAETAPKPVKPAVMRPAFVWNCPDCGRESVCRKIPKTVQCPACQQEFPAVRVLK